MSTMKTLLTALSVAFCAYFGATEYACAPPTNVRDLLSQAYERFGVPRKGLIHIGAHKAEELPWYQKLGVEQILWIEADPAREPVLREKLKGHKGSELAIFAAGETVGTTTFYTKPATTISSILPFLPPLRESKTWQAETVVKEVEMKPLDTFLSEEKRAQYNVMVVDTQGAELLTLKGAQETLAHVDAVIPEVAFCEVTYEEGASMQNLDEFLGAKGFLRMTTILSPSDYTHWGDALYLRKSLLTKEHLDSVFKKRAQQQQAAQKNQKAQRQPTPRRQAVQKQSTRQSHAITSNATRGRQTTQNRSARRPARK